jgi:multidrug efflux system membrane fusion protein
LVVLTETEPNSVIFVLPEDAIQDLWREARSGKTLSVTAYNRTDATLIATGSLESVDNLIDTTTGTIKLRANFPNTDEALFPNQFVNARQGRQERSYFSSSLTAKSRFRRSRPASPTAIASRSCPD